MSMGMFQVKQSNDEEFDIERFDDNSSPPPQSNLSAAAAGDKVNDNDDEGANENDGETAADGGGASFVSYLPCISVNKTVIAASTMLVIGITVAAVVASMSNGAVGNSQIQKSFATAGKAPKSFCEPPAITCGQTFTDQKVVLSDDLFCTDDSADANDSFNAAIKIKGPDAVLDCKGHTIIQRSSKNAAFCDGSFVQADREASKKACDLFYQNGILLVDGATVINCKVEHFQTGIYVSKGGEVKKSEVSANRIGLAVRNEVATGSTTKISDLYAYSNYDGVIVADTNAGDNGVTTIKDATIHSNINFGMSLRKSDVTVKDSVISYNGDDGIRITAAPDLVKVTFEGTVSSHHNDRGIVVGKQSTSPSADIFVNGKLNVCENDTKDIVNNNVIGDVDFVDSGTLTCGTRGGTGQADIPTCNDCPC